MRFLWVCLGGAAGTGARYLLSGWVFRALGPQFTYGTLAVNVLGSFLVAALMYLGTEAAALSPTARLALTTGVMGGFTTFSAFSYETVKYLQEDSWGLAAANMGTNVLGSVGACILGWVCARWLVPT